MGTLHLSLLLGGGLLVGLPILLHLTMRRKPKQLTFPALRFVKQRRQTNQTQLRLRHWTLLFFRTLAVLLVVMLMGLANLTAPADFLGSWLTIGVLGLLLAAAVLVLVVAIMHQGSRLFLGLAGGAVALLLIGLISLLSWTLATGGSFDSTVEEGPVTAIFVIDSSPRMLYVEDEMSRLEKSKQDALWLMRRLPTGSKTMVTDARTGRAIETSSVAAGEREIERLQATSLGASLPRKLANAISAARNAELPQKEIYVFSDLTEKAWEDSISNDLKTELAELKNTTLFLIDEGVARPLNFAIERVELSAEQLANNSPLEIEVTVSRSEDGSNSSAARAIELTVEEQNPLLPRDEDGVRKFPPAIPRGRLLVDLAPGETKKLTFPKVRLDPGEHFGQVKIEGVDGLEVDNLRHFSAVVSEVWPVLVVTPNDAEKKGVESKFLTEAIAPYQFSQAERARFRCDVIEQNDLNSTDLNEYKAVFFLDPTAPVESHWEQLDMYLQRGGSLAICLGRNASPINAFNNEAARKVLGVSFLEVPWREPGRGLSLVPRDMASPILAPFRDIATSTPWQQFPVFHHWVVDRREPEVSVIIGFSNINPALLERKVGNGYLYLLTTPISDPLSGRGKPWNEIPTGENAWPYFVLINSLAEQMVTRGARLNYLVGESATLNYDVKKDPESYTLFAPGDKPQEVTPNEDVWQFRTLSATGAYRLKGNRNEPMVRGFSVNDAAEISRLERVEPEKLTAKLGDKGVQLVTDRTEINRRSAMAKQDPEMYPYILMLFAGILGFEHLLANRFYRKRDR